MASISITSKSTTSVTFLVSGLTGAYVNHAAVELYLYGGSTQVQTKQLSYSEIGGKTSFSVTFSGLTPNTHYTIWSFVYEDSGWENVSSSLSISFYTDEESIVWALSGYALGTVSAAYSGSYSFGTYELKRFAVKFAASGTATFYTAGSIDTIGYLSTSTGYDNASGIPTSYVSYDDDSGTGTNCSISYNVAAGTTYYFWVRLYSGTNTGSVSVFVSPPPNTFYAAIAYNVGSGSGTIANTSNSASSAASSVSISVTVTSSVPTPPSGYVFDYWTYNGAQYAAGNTILITATSTNSASPTTITLTAHYSQKKKCYIFNGSAWVAATPYVFNGSAWVEATPYVYSSGWK